MLHPKDSHLQEMYPLQEHGAWRTERDADGALSSRFFLWCFFNVHCLATRERYGWYESGDSKAQATMCLQRKLLKNCVQLIHDLNLLQLRFPHSEKYVGLLSLF
jgi:hypothetical protein